MNQKNVDAIAALIDEWRGVELITTADSASLAALLASRGVLLPSALTDADTETLRTGFQSLDTWFPLAESLERIARGD